ncbi:MAG: sigma-70 family RNA polymerase sigma factor [Nannocystaceae bacterium]
MSDDDSELVREALAGHRVARRRLAERVLDSVQREVAFALARRRDGAGRDKRQEVRDLVQDVLVCLFDSDGRELRRWDPQRGRSLDSFVRLVARRRVARILGQRRGNPWALMPVASELLEGDDDAALLQRLEDRQTLDTLLESLYACMNERDHELFSLLFVEQTAPEEVARRLSLSRGAVNAWAYRMRKLARSLATGTATSSRDDTMTKEEVPHGR